MQVWLPHEARSSDGAGLSPADADVETRDRSALAAYVENVDEESQLTAAIALGRKLFAEGRGLLDLLTLHHTAIKSMLEPGSPVPRHPSPTREGTRLSYPGRRTVQDGASCLVRALRADARRERTTRDPGRRASCGSSRSRWTTRPRARRHDCARALIEHIARIRIQLPTSCPEGAVAFGLMPSAP
jgi:hypothetical protein